ncbi:MAG: hypothetical protein V4486_02730 [Patescibacteria group bacterium]
MDNKASFSDYFAKYISIITSPYIIVPAIGLWVIYIKTQNMADFILFGLTFLFCTIAPILLYVYFKMRSGGISDIHISIKEQRTKPFLISVAGSLALLGLYHLEHAPIVLMALAFVLFVSGFVFMLATLFSKVSIHVAGYLGSIFILYRLVDERLILLSLILPLVVWARSKREQHTLFQSLAAGFIVLICVFASLKLFGF